MAMADQVAIVCGFTSAEQARKRLDKLVQAGYVQKFDSAFEQKRIYAIKPRGLQLAQAESEYDLSHVKAPRGLDGNMAHLLAINATRLAIARHLPGAGGYLSWWKTDWELTETARIIPDALFQIDWHGACARVYALEVEALTRAPKRFLEKILDYGARKQQGQNYYGHDDFHLLVVCNGEDRMQRYYQSLNALTDRSWVWFTTTEAIVQSGGQDAIWRAADDGQSYPLSDLAT